MKTRLDRIAFCLVFSLAVFVSTNAHAETLSTGSAIIDFDATAWASLAGGSPFPGFEALVLDEFFDQAASNARTGAQILGDEVQATPPYSGQVYAMNGASVVNLAGRFTQPTTFNFSSGGLPTHTGAIGLGGVTRWAVNPLLGGGSLIYGDYTLQYDPLRIGSASGFPLNGTGWNLKANIAPAGAAFDLLNVNVTESAGTLTIAGDLGVTFEVANALYLTPSNQGLDVGNFSFTATVVPEPSSVLLALVGMVSATVGLRRRGRTANG